MPRIVMIIDEFHNMPQHTKESSKHTDILINILREYRKYGLSCIFSDQTSDTGLKPEAANQIKNRLAMSQNGYQEIIDTIGVSKSNFTAEKLHEMERTGQGEIWCKAFYGDGEKDFTIEQFKAVYAEPVDLQTVLDSVLKRNEEINCDTEVYVVDGEKRMPICIDEIRPIISSVKNADFAFCMGVPTSIEPFFCFDMEQRYGNNILVAGRNTELSNDVLVELLLSASMCGNNRILIFADPSYYFACGKV